MSKSRKTAMESALAYLDNRMRTIAEMRKHLTDKGYSQAEIDDCVSELIGFRYLDDYLYAMRYYEYNRERGRGKRRAQRELAEKGVDKETIANAGEDFAYENKVDEYEMALELAKKEIYVTSDRFADETENAFRSNNEVDETEDARGSSKDVDETKGAHNSKNGADEIVCRKIDDKLLARVARKLESRGFSYDDIRRVLEAVRKS